MPTIYFFVFECIIIINYWCFMFSGNQKPVHDSSPDLVRPFPSENTVAGEYISRRTILQVVAGVVGTAAVGTSVANQALEYIQDSHWPNDNTKVEAWISNQVHDPEFRQLRRFPRADVSSDGFGGRSAYELVALNMKLTDPINSRLTVFGGYRFGKNDITAAGMKYAAGRFYADHDVKSVKLNGRSMGSKVVFHAARAARSVEAMFLDSGPFDLDDARDAAAARIAIAVGTLLGYEGDIQVQTVINTYNIAKEMGPAEFLWMLQRAFKLTLQSENPEVIEDELSYIARDNPNTYVEELKRVLHPGVVAGYSFSKFRETDLVVNSLTGYEKYREFFDKNFGIELKALAYKVPGHAVMKAAALSAAEYLEAMYQEIDPYNSVQRRHAGQISLAEATKNPVISDSAREKLSKALASGVLPSRQHYLY